MFEKPNAKLLHIIFIPALLPLQNTRCQESCVHDTVGEEISVTARLRLSAPWLLVAEEVTTAVRNPQPPQFTASLLK